MGWEGLIELEVRGGLRLYKIESGRLIGGHRPGGEYRQAGRLAGATAHPRSRIRVLERIRVTAQPVALTSVRISITESINVRDLPAISQ
jgi:hypothetical protein